MARGAAAVAAGSALEEGAPRESQRTTDLDFEASLEEFQELARSAGAEVVATLIQRRPRPDPATLVGQQKAQVEKVLGELDVTKKPVIEVLNKIDLVSDSEAMPMGSPGSIAVSGLKKQGLDHLLAAIDAALVADPLIERKFRLPQSEGAVLAALEGGAIVKGKRFEGNLAYVTARGPASLLNRFRRFWENSQAQ